MMREKPTKQDFLDKGYVFDDKNKLIRTGRFFWSQEMKELADWCKENNIQYSFDIKGEVFLSGDGRLLALKGSWPHDNFPLKYDHVTTISV